MIVIITAGSVSGGLVILLLIVVLVIITLIASKCFKCRQKSMDMADNVAYVANPTKNDNESTTSYVGKDYPFESSSEPFMLTTAKGSYVEAQHFIEDSSPCTAVNDVLYEQIPVSPLSPGAADNSHQDINTDDECDYMPIVA